MYPTKNTFMKWARAATVADISEVLHICIEELRDRVGERQGAELVLSNLGPLEDRE